MNNLLVGAIAGAAGTIALDVASYTDMAARGRPASDMPAEVVRRIAERTGTSALARPPEQSSDGTKARRSALGALSGYAVGLGIGMMYGLARPFVRPVPLAVSAFAVGGIAMLATDMPASKLRATDLSTWGVSGWLSDAIPHAIYGLTVAIVFEALSREG